MLRDILASVIFGTVILGGLGGLLLYCYQRLLCLRYGHSYNGGISVIECDRCYKSKTGHPPVIPMLIVVLLIPILQTHLQVRRYLG